MLTTTPTPVTVTTAPRRFWALAANPRNYNIAGAVQELTWDSWTTKGSRVRRDDRVVIWKTRGPGRDRERGIIALGEVLSDPEPRSDHENPYWTDAHRPGPDQIEERGVVRYILSPRLPLWMNDQTRALLSQLSVSRAQGGTVFQVTPEQWALLLEHIGGWPDESEEPAEIADIRAAVTTALGRSVTGQGFLVSADERRAIERYAMDQAERHYRAGGWDVNDVSSRESYDLSCRRGDDVLHVEVKGTTGDGSRVLLTPNEVTHAQTTSVRVGLFIVAHITLTMEPSGAPHVTGGDEIVVEPWAIDDGTLQPLGFAYTLPRGERA